MRSLRILEGRKYLGQEKTFNFKLQRVLANRLPSLLLKKTGLVQGKILILQPRRIAARMLALQLSKVMQSAVGRTVGYHVRFDKQWNNETEVIYATDGTVLNYILNNNFPKDIELLIMDEFHERSAQVDLCLAINAEVYG